MKINKLIVSVAGAFLLSSCAGQYDFLGTYDTDIMPASIQSKITTTVIRADAESADMDALLDSAKRVAQAKVDEVLQLSEDSLKTLAGKEAPQNDSAVNMLNRMPELKNLFLPKSITFDRKNITVVQRHMQSGDNVIYVGGNAESSMQSQKIDTTVTPCTYEVVNDTLVYVHLKDGKDTRYELYLGEPMHLKIPANLDVKLIKRK